MRYVSTSAMLLAVSACTTAPTDNGRGRKQFAELNHVFATVDPATAEAIRASEFLRRFANFEVRTTTGTRATWTGRYLYGRQTYIEFFAPSDFEIGGKPAPLGAWGVALSGDSVGFNPALAQRLRAAGAKSLTEMETRKVGSRDVPWFEVLTAISEHGDSGALDETVTIWAMEYQASYFDEPQAGKEPPESSDDLISRERYQSDLYATKMMRDIAELNFDIGPTDFARIEPLLTAAGYRISRSSGEVLAEGAETDLRFKVAAQATPRLRQVRFSLNDNARRHVEAIGMSTLVVGPGATATWTFYPPPMR